MKRYIKLVQVCGDKEREIGQLRPSDILTLLYSYKIVLSMIGPEETKVYEKLRRIQSASKAYWGSDD